MSCNTATLKRIYFFGGGNAEGNTSLKPLLGGKGANLADMSANGLPVPPGFTITTEVCDEYYKLGKKYPEELFTEIDENIKKVEEITGKTFGYGSNPLLFSVRSGAAVSMPGMMDTVLNLGLNDQTLQALAELTGNERFAWDAYRRFLQMFGDVVLGIAHHDFEQALEKVKRSYAQRKGIADSATLQQEALNKKVPDTALEVADLKEVVEEYKKVYADNQQKFPQDPREQLLAAIDAVFKSWNNPRAIKYRQINDIRGLIGTAVNVQTMVFGNSGENSATGVAFTRDPSTGENSYFYGEYLINAQGEDVVAGIRTPQQITIDGSREWAKNNNISEEDRVAKYPSLEESMPECFKQLDGIRKQLENHYRDMQDLEFTIEQSKLYMLQTRNGKRTGAAAVRIAVDLAEEGLITEQEALLSIDPEQLDQLLHPVFDTKAEKEAEEIGRGLPASPGASSGEIVFNAQDAEKLAAEGHEVILTRIETSPEDVTGMHVAAGILTARGGMTSHAAVVARGWGKCCVSGCSELQIDYANKSLTLNGKTYKEGDYLSLNGSTGIIYAGKIKSVTPGVSGPFAKIMEWADKYRKLAIRTNADTPKDAGVAFRFGAQGIGLCRTEHMFFEEGRIISFRRFILVADKVKKLKEKLGVKTLDELDRNILTDKEEVMALQQYEQALSELLELQRADFKGIFEAMEGLPCTIRLLDPPLHEFLPQDDAGAQEMATNMGIEVSEVKKLVESLHEFNPMLGHRGCRLGISYPEITAMQVRAIIEAGCSVSGSQPEIMIPLVGNVRELCNQKQVALKVIEQIKTEKNITELPVKVKLGTMIEVPRAAMTADEIVKEADFFSFGTNDLTQMGCGFSRDDSGDFLADYVNNGIYDYNPFQSIDTNGVGRLMEVAIKYARSAKPDFKLGICGEHGGDPRSIEFCHKSGLTYVSCSPYRVPIARLAAAQAAIKNN